MYVKKQKFNAEKWDGIPFTYFTINILVTSGVIVEELL